MSVKKVIVVLLLLLSGAGSYYYFYIFNPTAGNNSKKESVDRFYKVNRGDLNLSLNFTGSVKSKKKHKLGLKASFPTKLTYVAEQNSHVKKGDVLARFEVEDLKQVIEDKKLELDNAKKELVIAEEEKRILESTNKAESRSAKDKVETADKALDQYRRLDGPKQKDSLTLKTEEMEALYNKSKRTYTKFKRKRSDSIMDADEEEDYKNNLASLEQAMNKAEINYNNSVLDRKKFKRYTYPNKILALENALAQSKLDSERTDIKTKSKMVQSNNNITKMNQKIRKIAKDLKKHEEYLPLMQIVSPTDGVIIYGDPDNRWDRKDVVVGMGVKRNETLITIPDTSEMIINFSIPEKYCSKVNQGFPVKISPESIPDLHLNGTIDHIASLPVNQIWWDRSSPKIYRANASLTTQNSKLVSGMSIEVEIIIQSLKNVLFVPIEAIFEEEGQYHVYTKTDSDPKKVFVTIGVSNENYVEVKSGLKEDETIYLFRPFAKYEQ